MAGSEPIFRVRNKDTRFTNGEPFSVLNLIPQSFENPTTEVAPTSEPGGTFNERAVGINRVVEFEGDIYWFHRNSIRVYVPGSGWTRSATTKAGVGGVLTSMNETSYNQSVIGLYPFQTQNGEQKLAAVYVDAASAGRLAMHVKNSRFTNDGSWSAEISFTPGGVIDGSWLSDGGNGYPALNGTKLYVQFRGFANERLYNSYLELDLEDQVATSFSRSPISDLPSNVTSTSGNNVHAIPPDVFCTYSGITWLCYMAGGAGASLGAGRPWQQPQAIVIERVRQIIPQLDLVVMTGIRPNGNAGGVGANQDFFEGRNEMFVIPESGRMYALTYIWGSGATNHRGWACWRLRYDNGTDSLLNEGDIGWKVLPPPLRLQTSSSLDNMHGRFKSYSLVDVSGQLTTILEFSRDGNEQSLENVYQWIDEDTEMRLLNTGGSAGWSKPLIKIGGGESVWSPRQPYNFAFRADASGADPGTLKLRTRIFGSSEAVKVRYYFTAKGHPMQRIANISAPTSGSISANELTGITANSGEFVVDWAIQAQGFNLNDVFNIHPIAEDD